MRRRQALRRMERHLDFDLDRIRQSLLRMGGLVEKMVADATQALVDRDTPLARDVVDRDHEIDLLEVEIDEDCHSILSRKQPTAVDLRFLLAVMKINSDLERIGDSAVNIAQSVQKLNEEPVLKPYVDIPYQSQLVQTRCARASTPSCAATTGSPSTSAAATTRWTASTRSSSASCSAT